MIIGCMWCITSPDKADVHFEILVPFEQWSISEMLIKNKGAFYESLLVIPVQSH